MEVTSTYRQTFGIFCQKKDHIGVFNFFGPRGYGIEPMVVEDWDRDHSKGNKRPLCRSKRLENN